MSLKRAPGWKIYRDQISQLDHGDALWEPAPLNYFKRVRLGDVGYVRKGCFHLLFSAGKPLGERQLGADVPLTFQPLDVGPIVNLQPRLPGCLSTNTVREAGASLGATISAIPMLEPGFSISFEHTEKQGAALVTKYSTYREDVQREQIFEEYTRHNYDSWVAFAREGGHGNDIKPVLVTGVDLTRDFAMMSYLNNGVRLKSEFTASVPGVVSASASAWGTWRTEGLVHTNCGPQLCLPPSSTQTTDLTLSSVSNTEPVSEEYNQCVFIRYYTMRKRPLMIPKIIKAAAGPHDLGPGDRDNEEPPLGFGRGSPILSDDSGDDERRSPASTDPDSDVVFHNTARDESEEFDMIADYIFRNSDAESVLAHHRDLALLRKAGGNQNTLTQLLEKHPSIMVDRDGVGKILHSTDPSTNTQPSDLLEVTPSSPSEVELGSPSRVVLPEPRPSTHPDPASRLAHRYPRLREELLSFLMVSSGVVRETLFSIAENTLKERQIPTHIIDALDKCQDEELLEDNVPGDTETDTLVEVKKDRVTPPRNSAPASQLKPTIDSRDIFLEVTDATDMLALCALVLTGNPSFSDKIEAPTGPLASQGDIHPDHPGVLNPVLDPTQFEEISPIDIAGFEYISPFSTLIRCGRENILKCLVKAELDEDLLNAELFTANIHQSLPTHPNIVTLYSTLETPSYLLMLFEYVPGQDLFYYLEELPDSHEQESPPSPSSAGTHASPTLNLLSSLDPDQLLSPTRLSLISSMFTQMCQAVAVCHALNVSHRDIKPESFIITEERVESSDCRQESKVVVKLTDFGLSTNDIESADMGCGSTPYMSYECRNKVAPTYVPSAADVWSLGIVLINMLYHYNPWSDTAEGACSSFELYLRNPISFFMQRFPGMTMPVAHFLATRVFCILGNAPDDNPRVSAEEFGVWVKDLPAHFLAPGPRLPGPKSWQAPIDNTVIERGSSSTSPPPPFARGFVENELPTIPDNVNEGDFRGEPPEEEVQPDPRESPNVKRRKRGARKNKGKDVQAEQVDLTLETLAETSQALAREISRSSKAPASVTIDGGLMFSSQPTPIRLGSMQPSQPSDDPARDRGRRRNSPYGAWSQSHIKKWVDSDEKRDVSPTSTTSGRYSSASSMASSNWRSSPSTSSSSTFTRYSNNSVSTVATSMSDGRWRNANGSKYTINSGRSGHRNGNIPPPNVKLMHGVPWELGEPARKLRPSGVNLTPRLPPSRKRENSDGTRGTDKTTRAAKEKQLDTISERPTKQSVDASTSTEDLSDGVGVGKDGDTFDGAGQMKVNKGPISALAKMLSALRR